MANSQDPTTAICGFDADTILIRGKNLVEDVIGRGLGSTMLQRVISYIYTRAPSRIIIQTCTLDHPSALPLYQRFGFKPVGRKQVTIIDEER